MADYLAKAEGLEVSSQDVIDEKTAITSTSEEEPDVAKAEHYGENDRDSDDVIIVSGADAAQHLLPLRDDFEQTVTFRSMLLASILACFQAVMNQIYMVSYMLDGRVTEGLMARLFSSIPTLILVNSLNRLLSPFKELSLSSSHTLLGMRGLSFFLVAISLRLAGYRKGAKANFLSILRSSSLLTQGNGL